MFMSWWCHGDVMFMSWWCHGDVMVMSWWCHVYVLVMLWWCHGVVLRCFDSDLANCDGQTDGQTDIATTKACYSAGKNPWLRHNRPRLVLLYFLMCVVFACEEQALVVVMSVCHSVRPSQLAKSLTKHLKTTPWHHHVITMTTPWQHHDITMTPPWHHHVSSEER